MGQVGVMHTQIDLRRCCWRITCIACITAAHLRGYAVWIILSFTVLSSASRASSAATWSARVAASSATSSSASFFSSRSFSVMSRGMALHMTFALRDDVVA